MEPAIEQTIRGTTAALLKAINASDVEAVMAVWDPRGVLMPPGHSSVQGRESIREYFERVFQQSRFSFVFAPSQVSIEGDLAVERLEYSASVTSLQRGDVSTDRGKGVHVYRRQHDASWKLVLDIWNSDER